MVLLEAMLLLFRHSLRIVDSYACDTCTTFWASDELRQPTGISLGLGGDTATTATTDNGEMLSQVVNLQQLHGKFLGRKEQDFRLNCFSFSSSNICLYLCLDLHVACHAPTFSARQSRAILMK